MTATKSITLTGLIPLYRLRVLVTKREAVTNQTENFPPPANESEGAVAAGEARGPVPPSSFRSRDSLIAQRPANQDFQHSKLRRIENGREEYC